MWERDKDILLKANTMPWLSGTYVAMVAGQDISMKMPRTRKTTYCGCKKKWIGSVKNEFCLIIRHVTSLEPLQDCRP
jgi:hypothetical protein